jgi:hypothetical protein
LTVLDVSACRKNVEPLCPCSEFLWREGETDFASGCILDDELVKDICIHEGVLESGGGQTFQDNNSKGAYYWALLWSSSIGEARFGSCESLWNSRTLYEQRTRGWACLMQL